MLPSARALLLLIISALPVPAVAEPLQRVPDLSGYFLNGDPVSLPADLSRPATLLVIIEEDPGTQDLSGWRAVSAELGGQVPTLFVVVMGERRGVARAMAAGRLRAEVVDPVLRGSMVPVFQETDVLRRALGVASGSGVSAILVNADGDVFWRARGAASETTLTELAGALQAPVAAGVVAPRAVVSVLPVTGSHRLEAVEPPAPAPAQVPVAAASLSAPEPGTEALLPALSGYTLSGQKRLLPDDLSKAGTRLILVPGYAGTDLLITVIEDAASGADQADWLVLMFMGDAPRLGKAAAAGRLRGDIPSLEMRARVMPVYMDLSVFERRAGLAPGRGVRSVEVTRSGVVSEPGCSERRC